MSAQRSSLIASIRARTLRLGTEAEQWRCKQSKGVDERVVQARMYSKLGRRELNGVIGLKIMEG